MAWVDHIVAEAAKTFMQALKITGYLAWWLMVGLVALVRRTSWQIQADSLRGAGQPNSGQPIEAQPCPVCGTLNEGEAKACFSCGYKL